MHDRRRSTSTANHSLSSVPHLFNSPFFFLDQQSTTVKEKSAAWSPWRPRPAGARDWKDVFLQNECNIQWRMGDVWPCKFQRSRRPFQKERKKERNRIYEAFRPPRCVSTGKTSKHGNQGVQHDATEGLSLLERDCSKRFVQNAIHLYLVKRSIRSLLVLFIRNCIYPNVVFLHVDCIPYPNKRI